MRCLVINAETVRCPENTPDRYHEYMPDHMKILSREKFFQMDGCTGFQMFKNPSNKPGYLPCAEIMDEIPGIYNNGLERI
jgi:hypothetical protein